MTIFEIKNFMKSNKITYQKLAEASNVPITTIKDIFRGATQNPRIDTMRAIEDALGINKEPTSQEEVSSKLKNAMAVVGLKPCDLDTLSEEQIGLVVGFAQQLIDKQKK